MKKCLIIAIAFFGLTNAYSDIGDENGRAREANTTSSISAVNRLQGDRYLLVLQKNKTDILTIPDTPPGLIPKLQDAVISGESLAVVIDYDYFLCYQLFVLKDGAWKKTSQLNFCHMVKARPSLIAVQMSDLTHVKIFSAPKGSLEPRKRGVIRQTDQQDVFEFPKTGGVFKNGKPYDFNGGQEIESK